MSIYGGVNGQTYDDEDRLTSFTTSAGVTDTFTYNGLGLRVGKTDSTGTYAYLCDGASPGSPVLSDGHAVYTPGLSESRAGVSSYYDFDQMGNLWTVDTATGKGQAYYQDTSGFGTVTSAGGVSASPFKFGGGNGCQTDADAGLVLMGYRYLDTRTGRFLTQDPAGDGDNWYCYAGNSPTNAVDPTGLEQTAAQQGNDVWMAITSGEWYGQELRVGQDGGIYFTGLDGTNYGFLTPFSNSVGDINTSLAPQGGGDVTGPSLGEDIGAGLAIGGAAVGSAASFHLWNGGAARNDPSFGVSRGLADVGIAAGTAAFGAAGAAGRAAEETVTVSRWGRSGLKAGDWVMKGKASRWNHFWSGKMQPRWMPGNNEPAAFETGVEYDVLASSVKWPTGAGIDGWLKGLFGQRMYLP